MPVSLPIVPKSFPKPAEPFGLLTTPILQSPLAAKWREVERSIEAELQSVANCRVHYQSCASPQARLFLAIVEEARRIVAEEGTGALPVAVHSSRPRARLYRADADGGAFHQ